MSETDTPRTDALLAEINEGRCFDQDGPVADFSRQLERELAAMTTRAESAERERDALAKENEWHPASVRPELHEHVMTIDSMGQLHIDFWYPTENRFWSERDGDDDEKITHWRKLPQPPKGEAT